MDMKKLIEENSLSNFPIGLGGCRTSDMYHDSCDHDIFVFDGRSEPGKIIRYDENFAIIHHASLSETNSEKLLQYKQLEILQDESWDLRMMLSRIKEKHALLFSDFAKNCLIESQFCCQKTIESVQTSDVFASCWQKCAAYYLAKSILSTNHLRISPSHMLDSLRKLKKSPTNKHLSTVTRTVGIERATPTLLERMMKSTIGFSDLIEGNGHSQIIRQKYDFFIKNSMLSDCYFYLGYLNVRNFMKIKDTLPREQDLFHILKVAFDVEADSNLLLQQSDLVRGSCDEILGILSSA